MTFVVAAEVPEVQKPKCVIGDEQTYGLRVLGTRIIAVQIGAFGVPLSCPGQSHGQDCPSCCDDPHLHTFHRDGVSRLDADSPPFRSDLFIRSVKSLSPLALLDRGSMIKEIEDGQFSGELPDATDVIPVEVRDHQIINPAHTGGARRFSDSIGVAIVEPVVPGIDEQRFARRRNDQGSFPAFHIDEIHIEIAPREAGGCGEQRYAGQQSPHREMLSQTQRAAVGRVCILAHLMDERPSAEQPGRITDSDTEAEGITAHRSFLDGAALTDNRSGQSATRKRPIRAYSRRSTD